MSKIDFLIIGTILIIFFASNFLVGCSLTNPIEKKISDITLLPKYRKYVDVNQNPIFYEENTMVMLPEGKNKEVGYAFVNQKNELIISDDNPVGYLKYDPKGNIIDKIETKSLDGREHLLNRFYGDYLMDFEGKRYCTWAIDGDKSFKEMELVSHSEQWDVETQKNFYLEEIKDKSPYYDIIDDNFFFFKDNKWSYFSTKVDYFDWKELKYGIGNRYSEEEMQEGKCISLFSRRERKLAPKEESKKRDKFIPEHFKIEERGSHRGSTIGGGSMSYLTTWKKGILFFKLQVNGQTFGLKNEESIYNDENIMKDKTSYFRMYGGILENCGEYDVYTHPQLEYALFAPNEILSYDICPVFIIKNKKE